MRADGELALMGGDPVITTPFLPYTSLGEEEVKAAERVVRSGVLSAYVGSAGPGFMGGPEVRSMESEAAEYFGVRHALAVNSWTSGLHCCVGALALTPGDEVITSPWTMAATATVILQWNAVPVFADINPLTFNLDPARVEEQITERTRAVLAPDIFGQSADIEALMGLCDRHGLKLISDTAQAPGATRHGSYAGTQSHIGGYSLNYHKHITCGEGGIVVTNDDALADRVALLRNHGEVLVGQGHPITPRFGVMGSNFRMGEIEAAITRSQLPKLSERTRSRESAADRLTAKLASLDGLRTPHVDSANSHVYYVYPLVLEGALRPHRARIVAALQAEGVPAIMSGYQNIHRLPLFAQHLAFGASGFPYPRDESAATHCPVAEELHDQSFMGILLCAHEFTAAETEQVAAAFAKVWSHLPRLLWKS
jgi:dTDP-4-amino-4,6-dideoxygalactose transaminase